MARWDNIGRSGNVVDRRGVGGGVLSLGGGGLLAIIITLALNYFGVPISQTTVEQVIGQVQSFQSEKVDQSQQPAEFRGDDSYEVFTKKVLGSSDELWSNTFSQNGGEYSPPRLVLFRGTTSSACGIATSQVGPHYCPNDSTIYLDETFFDELHRRFGASTGEVAQAYVIAHEVGHHVQNELGDLEARRSREASITTELQADCYAGIWAYSQSRNNVIDENEIDQALSAAAAVGDDNIQQKTTGRVSPESWTHGSSEQRVSAFKKGYSSGNPAQCRDVGA